MRALFSCFLLVSLHHGMKITLPVPSQLISFNSTEGMKIFRKPTTLTTNFFAVAPHFITQETESFCAIASLASILNSFPLGDAPIDPIYVPYGYYTQNDILNNSCVKKIISRQKVLHSGTTLATATKIAGCFVSQAVAVHANQTNPAEFRKFMTHVLDSQAFDSFGVAINYARGGLGQVGHGHFSPISAYDPETDRLLVMDVASYKYPWVWAPLPMVVKAMSTIDSDANDYRGFMFVVGRGKKRLGYRTKILNDWVNRFRGGKGSYRGNVGVATPPPVAQCKPIDAPEPSECPNHIGPPCPPCYVNAMPDYQSGDSIAWNTSMLTTLNETLVMLADKIYRNAPPRTLNTGWSVFVGTAGRGLVFLRLALNEGNPSLRKTYLNRAQEYIDTASREIFGTTKHPSYFLGYPGVYTLEIILNHVMNPSANSSALVKKVVETYQMKFADDYCGIDEGWSGLQYASMLLNTVVSSSTIDVQNLETMVRHIITNGMEHGKKNNVNYMLFDNPIDPGCYMYGSGHGSGGVIHMLLLVAKKFIPKLLNDTTFTVPIINTLNELMSTQYDDGNMPTAKCPGYPKTNDTDVQWCHGAPGFVSVFSSASILFGSQNATLGKLYLNAAIKAADATWSRGLLTKGLMYCHGVGGNAYMLWNLAENLKNMPKNMYTVVKKQDIQDTRTKMLWRVKKFVEWSLSPAHVARLRDGDTPYAMFQGTNSIVMLYSQLYRDAMSLENVSPCMPGWNLCV